MNIFNNLISVESVTDLFIVKYGLFISLIFYIPFISVLIGSLLYSLVNFRKGKIFNSNLYFSFAKFSADLVLNRLWLVVLAGVFFVISTTFFYTQINPNLNFENLTFAMYLNFAGLILALSYRGSFSIFKISNIEITDAEIVHKNKNLNVLYFGGWIGFILLAVSSFIYISYINFAFVKNSSIDPISILFNNYGIINYLLFLAVSFSITPALIGVFANKRKDAFNFKDYANEFSTKSGILFTFVQPILFVMIIFSVTDKVLSFSYFISSILVLGLMLISSVQFYLWYKGNGLKRKNIVLTLILILFMLVYHSQLNSEKVNQKFDIKNGKVINLFS